jgi:hypothetical protein
MNDVDLFEVLEPCFDFLYPFQPLQGCFAHIISTDVKGDRGYFPTHRRDGGKERRKKKERQDKGPQWHGSETTLCFHGFCPHSHPCLSKNDFAISPGCGGLFQNDLIVEEGLLPA